MFAVVFGYVKDQAVAAFNLIMVPIQAVMDGAVVVYNWFKGVFATVWDFVKDAAVTALNLILIPINAIKDGALVVYNWFKNVFAFVFDTVKDGAVTAFRLILAPINAIKDAAVAVYNWLKDTLTPYWDVGEVRCGNRPEPDPRPDQRDQVRVRQGRGRGEVRHRLDREDQDPRPGSIASKLNPASKSALCQGRRPLRGRARCAHHRDRGDHLGRRWWQRGDDRHPGRDRPGVDREADPADPA